MIKMKGHVTHLQKVNKNMERQITQLKEQLATMKKEESMEAHILKFEGQLHDIDNRQGEIESKILTKLDENRQGMEDFHNLVMNKCSKYTTGEIQVKGPDEFELNIPLCALGINAMTLIVIVVSHLAKLIPV